MKCSVEVSEISYQLGSTPLHCTQLVVDMLRQTGKKLASQTPPTENRFLSNTGISSFYLPQGCTGREE